jgi:TetR/AcrR family transcriptional regulator, transcriptional repressor for nem operon
MVQEVYATRPEIRQVYGLGIIAHAEEIKTEIAAALKRHRIRSTWTASSLALHTQAVLQGAFVIAKATGDVQLAAASIDHLRRYIELLFGKAESRHKKL